MRGMLIFIPLAVGLTMAAQAFQPIPRESAKALGVTRAKAFSAGMVFVNGKYVEPPYRVERWGTGIRINTIPVTGQIIDWNEFLKTQPDVKVEKSGAAEEDASVPSAVPAVPAAPRVPAPSVAAETSSLDDLFDDLPPATKAKPTASPAAASSPAAPTVRKPAAKPSVTYVLSGEFEANDASKALVGRINSTRTDIDKILRSGGFIFFGDRYSWVTGDKRTLMTMLETLPELQQQSQDLDTFKSGARAAKLIYLNESLCEDLFSNRLDYLKIKRRRESMLADEKLRKFLGESSDSVF